MVGSGATSSLKWMGPTDAGNWMAGLIWTVDPGYRGVAQASTSRPSACRPWSPAEERDHGLRPGASSDDPAAAEHALAVVVEHGGLSRRHAEGRLVEADQRRALAGVGREP